MNTPNVVAVDLETTGLNAHAGDRPFAASAAFPNGRRLFWRATEGQTLKRGDFSDLDELIEDPKIDKVFHNAKFDWRMLDFSGFKMRGRAWDTQILCHLIDGRQAGTGLRLENCAARFLPPDRRKIVDEVHQWFDANGVGSDVRYERFNILPPDLLRRRIIGDADLTLRIFHRLWSTVSTTFPFLLEQEHRLLPVVKRMEDRGILVDVTEVERQKIELTTMLDAVQHFFEGFFGEDDRFFNVNARGDLEEALRMAGIWDQLRERTKPSKTFPNGQIKLDDSVLRGLHHPVAHWILLGKTAAKFRDTFLSQAVTNAVANVLHANFNQLGTNTGRFSCSGPNLQNIPIEGDRRAQFTNEEADEQYEITGYRIAPHLKRCFAVRSGHCHLHADKKQAEMAMLAHYTRDKKLIGFFESGKSIHDEITMELFGEYSKGLKTQAKRVVFGYQYGAGNACLAHTLSSTLEVAVKLRNRLAAVFPALPRWKREMDAQISERGYVQTIHGRRHYLRGGESYMSVNRMCQGTVGDEIKSRMIAIDDWAQKELPEATVLLNIHDDIATECPVEARQFAAHNIHRIMHETSMEYLLPLPSSMDITYTSYGDLKEIDDVNNIPPPPDGVVDRPKYKSARMGSDRRGRTTAQSGVHNAGAGRE